MPETAPSTSASAKSADDRATSFQPSEGGPQLQSGGALLVEAYAVCWVILMAWLWVMWRKQKALHDKIDGLEKTIDRAAAKLEAKK
jgi:hypothetical protein